MAAFGRIDAAIIGFGAPSLSSFKIGHVLILIGCEMVLIASAACVPNLKVKRQN